MIYSTVKPVEGAPYKIFPLNHNWQTPFKAGYQFLTDIITSGNGKEQRRAVRFEPRRTLELACNYFGEEKQQLERFMARGMEKPCWVPEENLVCRTTSYMFGDDKDIFFEGAKQSWMEGGQIVILSNGWRKETRTIQSAGDGTMTFSDKSKVEFPAGTKICPAVLAYIDLQPKATRLTSVTGTMGVKAEVLPGSELYPVGNAEQIFIGVREFFGGRNNWGSSPEIDYLHERRMIDYDYGVVEAFLPFKYPARTMKTTYLRKTAATTNAVIDFFLRHKGRNREFLMQSFEPDVPYYAIASGSQSLLIKGLDFAYTYKDSTVFKRIMIKPKIGEPIHAQVDYVEALEETQTSVLWLTEPLPDAINLSPSKVFGASWVFVSRFATDRLDVEWLTDEVGSLALTVQTLENFDV